LVTKSGEKRTLRGPKCRWEDNIRTDLKEVVQEGVEWINLAEDPVAGSCEHGNEHSVFIKAENFLTI
jgi:hypothetical protein